MRCRLPRGHPGGKLRAVAGVSRQRGRAPFSSLAVLATAGYAWVGMWTIGTDYWQALLRSAGNAAGGSINWSVRGCSSSSSAGPLTCSGGYKPWPNSVPVTFDAVIVGGGGSRMRTALQLAQAAWPACVRRVSQPAPIPCPLGGSPRYQRRSNDDWRWHVTRSRAPTIGDQDAIQYMCSVGPQAVFELEHMGLRSLAGTGRLPATFGAVRTMERAGKRPGPARRTERAPATFSPEPEGQYDLPLRWFAVDLVKNKDGAVTGVVAICIEPGDGLYPLQGRGLATSGPGGSAPRPTRS